MSERKGGPVFSAATVPRKQGEAKCIFRQNVTDLVDILHVKQKQAAEMIAEEFETDLEWPEGRRTHSGDDSL